MARLGVAGDPRPMLVLEVLGNQSFDAQSERLRGRLYEDVGGRLIPEDYSLGFGVRHDNRVPDSLKESADT